MSGNFVDATNMTNSSSSDLSNEIGDSGAGGGNSFINISTAQSYSPTNSSTTGSDTIDVNNKGARIQVKVEHDIGK
jgi:hypothetical protein